LHDCDSAKITDSTTNQAPLGVISASPPSMFTGPKIITHNLT